MEMEFWWFARSRWQDGKRRGLKTRGRKEMGLDSQQREDMGGGGPKVRKNNLAGMRTKGGRSTSPQQGRPWSLPEKLGWGQG